MQRIKKYVITEMPNGYPPTLHSTIMSTLRTFTSIFVYVARNDIKCKVPHSTTFTHGGIGVVMAKDVKLGGHCVIGHNVTIGTSHKGIPSLGWGVVVCCHSVIFGNCHIGHHSFIGAGSVVFKDIPPYSVVAGNPAVVIKTIKSDAEYWMYRRER